MESFAKGIEDYKKGKKAQIYGAFKKSTETGRVAVPITKSDFDTQYPADRFEYYTLDGLDRLRQDILKADGIEDRDGAFKKATEDLKAHVVHSEGQKVILFTREKQKGE